MRTLVAGPAKPAVWSKVCGTGEANFLKSGPSTAIATSAAEANGRTSAAPRGATRNTAAARASIFDVQSCPLNATDHRLGPVNQQLQITGR
jgi:hypothetical protein